MYSVNIIFFNFSAEPQENLHLQIVNKKEMNAQ
jgi:hypothetical protein